MLNLNFEGPVCAPMRVVEAQSWSTHYWKNHELRPKYFDVVARQLKDKLSGTRGEFGCWGKYLCRGFERSM